jgi:serine-type D-Ala-D-Ala carboxypeptidase/endopeptidase (penicillin-binding protein 4)
VRLPHLPYPVRLLLCLALALHSIAYATPLQERIAGILAEGAGANASWGWEIRSGDRLVFQTNAGAAFIPASNTKLFTTAAALDRFGPDHRFRTSLCATARPTAGGRLEGDLIIVVRGDPALRATNGDWSAALVPLARALTDAGVRHITGSLCLDTSALRVAPAGPGWEADDLVERYAAPVSAAVANDNTFLLQAVGEPRAGMPIVWRTRPLPHWVTIEGQVLGTTNAGAVWDYARAEGSGTLRLSGSVPQGERGLGAELAVPDASAYFLELFRDTLRRLDVRVDGTNRFRIGPLPAQETELAALESPPMAELAARCLKPSQNLHAQLLLAQLGADARHTRRAEDPQPEAMDDLTGLRVLGQFLDRTGIGTNQVTFEEGSGLSRANRVSPTATVRLLRRMQTHPAAGAWQTALPVGGIDGTLKNRFTDGSARGNVRAKTGTLRGVHALAGYVTTRAGEPLVFAAYANFPPASGSAQIRQRIDRVIQLLADQQTPCAPE